MNQYPTLNELDLEQPRPIWLTRQRNATTWFMIQIAMAMTIMVPHNNALAGTTVYSRPAQVVSPYDANGVDMSWAHWAAQSQSWISRYDPDGNLSINVPKDNFALVGRSVWHAPTPAGGSGSVDFQMIRMIQGDKWITLGRETVGQAGVTNAQMSDQIARFPKNTDYIFAQYSPENATAHITIQRIEKTPSGMIEVRVADFTPWHGEYWAAAGDYRTSMEVLAKVPGHNPFLNFEGASKTDPLFHNITYGHLASAVRKSGGNHAPIREKPPEIIPSA